MPPDQWIPPVKPDLLVQPKKLDVSYFGGLVHFKTEIVWPNVIFFAILHYLGMYGVWLGLVQMSQLQFASVIYMFILGTLGGEGTTLGAHRLWCHRAYKARFPLRVMLILWQTLAGQNCCHKWVRDHRQHHKYSDTDGDPHNINRGLFFSHIGWLLMKKHPEAKAKAATIYMADVERDPIVMFQKRHFKKVYFLFGVLIPSLLPCVVWGESLWNSIFITYFARYVLLLHATWTVNSLAHYYGTRPYDKKIGAAENGFVSFLVYGEGWHNYHHKFPWDYKASEYGKHLNLTRDAIEFFERRGWAYDLKEVSYEMMVKIMKKSGDGTHPLAQQKRLEHAAATEDIEAEGW